VPRPSPRLSRRALLSALPAVLAGCRRTAAPSNTAVPRVESLDVSHRPEGWLGLPNHRQSYKLAVIGDSGRGWAPQHQVAQQMVRYRDLFPFSTVLMLGDNIYEGPATPLDYQRKFEEPYRALLDAGVRFQAVLGNHDDVAQRFYAPFNMRGHRYYTFEPPGPTMARVTDAVRVFAIDSTSLDADQLQWLERELRRSRARWKLCMLHHPLYTGGRYGKGAYLTRWKLEALLVDTGVDVVLSGHEHLYQRTLPQQGIVHFISGAAGSLREGDAREGGLVARAYDRDYHFMLIEIAGEALHWQAITRTGRTIDAGVLHQPPRS
jgi:predicted phosphodiesterase